MDIQPIFRALSDQTRRDILQMLSQRDMTISEVAENFDMTRAAVKKHLTILAEGNLIGVTPRGREKVNHLNPNAIKPAFDWLSHFETFWDEKLGNLKSIIENSHIGDDDHDGNAH